MGTLPYTSYAAYLRDRYGQRVYRVGVDGGFSCPHREGRDPSTHGCIYCDATGSRAPYLGDLESLRDQIRGARSFLRSRYGATAFLLYFQANSSTNAPPETLSRLYDAGLAEGDFLELIVSTRPDCLDPEKADLLAGYSARGMDVWVELGLQSAHESTLRRIRRAHNVGDFLYAYQLLRERGVKICVHLIAGLPGEGLEDMLGTIRIVSDLFPEGVKLHNLHICRNTALAEMHRLGEVTAPGAEAHLEYLVEALRRLPPRTLIMRATCDTPRDRLLAPRRFPDKAAFLRLLETRMQEGKSYQGELYNPESQPAVDRPGPMI